MRFLRVKALALIGGWMFCVCSALAFECVAIGVCERDSEYGACQFFPTSNVMARLPNGLRIVEVGEGSLFYKVDKDEAIDFLACKSVVQLAKTLSLDEYDLEGWLKIKGSFQATGRIRYEPNDGGDLLFLPDKTALWQGGRFFQGKFSRIKLDGLGLSRFTPPKHLAQTDCWEARATLKVTDVEVVVEGSSKAGTYPNKAQLISPPKRYTRCTWGE